jgi:Cytochrome P450
VVAGTTIYIITSANDATLVLKNIENLTFDEYVRDMMLRFGTASAAVEAMWKHPPDTEPPKSGLTPNPLHKCLAHLQESILKQQLLPGEKFQSLSDEFLGYISVAISWERMTPKAILSEPTDSRYRIVGLLEWTKEVLLDSATRTFFGDGLLDIEPELFTNFVYFDDNSWLFTYKIPKPWSKGMMAAKDVVQKALHTYFDLPSHDRPGQSWLIRTLEDEMRGLDIESKDIAAMFNMIFWVINGNAYKLCFWILAHLLHNGALFSAVRAEVAGAIDADTPVEELPNRLDSCKELDAVYHEVLRLISSSMAVRNVANPMDVGGKTLNKGTKILVPFRQIHFNEAVWGANASDFDPRRFLGVQAKEERSASRNPNFRPFGGGTTICPGRFLARREVLTFVGLALVRFDMSLDGTSSKSNTQARQNTFPRLEEGKPCLGMMPPANGENVRIKVTPKHC